MESSFADAMPLLSVTAVKLVDELALEAAEDELSVPRVERFVKVTVLFVTGRPLPSSTLALRYMEALTCAIY